MRQLKLNNSLSEGDLQADLQLLHDQRAAYNPTLPQELGEYLELQARFIVTVARQYCTSAATWPMLLAAGQQALVQAWQECAGEQHKMDRVAAHRVREAMIAVATLEAAAVESGDGPYAWALAAGETEEMATVFADCNAKRTVEYEQGVSREITAWKLKAVEKPELAIYVLKGAIQNYAALL